MSIVLPTFISVLFTLIQGHSGLQKVGGKVLICSCWSWDSINFRLSGCMKKVIHKMLVMALACIYFKECNWCFCLNRSSLQMFKSDKYWAWPPLNITCSWIPVSEANDPFSQSYSPQKLCKNVGLLAGKLPHVSVFTENNNKNTPRMTVSILKQDPDYI